MAKKQSWAGRAQIAHLTAIKNKQIAGTAIFSRFIHCLGLQPNVDLTKPVPLGGGLTNWDLALELMRYRPFNRDGLILNKKDVIDPKMTAGALCNLIYAWYNANGWTVT